MKKILIITMVILLQNGFCSNISRAANYNNDALVQKMGKDKDVVKFFKLALAKKLSEEILLAKEKNSEKISVEEKESFEKLCNKTIISLETVNNKYPEFNDLSINEKRDVIRAVGSLNFSEIVVCLGALYNVVKDVCGSITKIEAAVLGTCFAVSAAWDIAVVYFTGGIATPTLLPVVTAETTYCATIAKTAAYGTCIVSGIATIVVCLQNEAGD
ncbi:MAG: hypothetical protein MUF58_13600 [Arcicella sp.]|jgi:hypothetical protein|nr:hypothetical protein [Arcicella sp.]